MTVESLIPQKGVMCKFGYREEEDMNLFLHAGGCGAISRRYEINNRIWAHLMLQDCEFDTNVGMSQP